MRILFKGQENFGIGMIFTLPKIIFYTPFASIILPVFIERDGDHRKPLLYFKEFMLL